MLPKCSWRGKQHGLDAPIFQHTEAGLTSHRMSGYVCNLSPLQISLTSEFHKPSIWDHNRTYSRTAILVQLCANDQATILMGKFMVSSNRVSPHCMRLHGLCSWRKGYIMTLKMSNNSNDDDDNNSNNNNNTWQLFHIHYMQLKFDT